MSGFDLPNNFVLDLEALLRKKGSHASTSSTTLPTTEPLTPIPAAIITMAQKSLREFSVPAISNAPIGPVVNIRDKNFELRTKIITMV